jgi:hypothetical protein
MLELLSVGSESQHFFARPIIHKSTFESQRYFCCRAGKFGKYLVVIITPLCSRLSWLHGHDGSSQQHPSFRS